MALTFSKTETNYDQVTGVGFATHTITTGFDDIVITDADNKEISEYARPFPASIGVKYNTSAGGRSGISDYFMFRMYIDSTYLVWANYDNMVQITGGWQRKTISLLANTNGLIPLNPRTGYAWGTYRASNFFDATNKTTPSVPINVYAYSGRVSTGTYDNGGFYPSVAYASLSNELVGTINLRLNVPPTFDNTALSIDTTTAYTDITTASVTVSNATAYYGGDISSATLTIGQQTASISGNGTISILLNAGGTFTPTLSVTDSRGQVATKSLDPITVNVYTAPSVNFDVERTTSTGTPDDEGTHATVDATLTFADVIADAIAPTVTVTDEDGVQTTPTVTWYSTRGADGTLSGSVTWSSLSSGDTVYGLIPNLNTEFSWQIAITPKDSEGTGTPITQTLAGAFYTIDFLAGGHGIAFGQPAINDGFECNMPTTFHDTVDVEDTLTAQDMTSQEIDDFIDSIGGGGDPVADVVVEQGTSGIWTYRKWSSGISECWASVNTSTNFAVWTNPIYYGTTYSARQNFPTGLFIATPKEQVTMYASGADVWVGADSTNRVSSTQTGRYYPLRVGSGSTATFTTQFYDFGRWK